MGIGSSVECWLGLPECQVETGERGETYGLCYRCYGKGSGRVAQYGFDRDKWNEVCGLRDVDACHGMLRASIEGAKRVPLWALRAWPEYLESGMEVTGAKGRIEAGNRKTRGELREEVLAELKEDSEHREKVLLREMSELSIDGKAVPDKLHTQHLYALMEVTDKASDRMRINEMIWKLTGKGEEREVGGETMKSLPTGVLIALTRWKEVGYHPYEPHMESATDEQQ